jgi:hypothetical protein
MSDTAAVRATARATPTMHNVPEATLFAIESQAELNAIQQAMAGPKQAAQAPTTRPRPDPDKGLYSGTSEGLRFFAVLHLGGIRRSTTT